MNPVSEDPGTVQDNNLRILWGRHRSVLLIPTSFVLMRSALTQSPYFWTING